MDRGRLKTFILLLLLAVNLAFLAIIAADRVESAQLRSQTREELVAVLAGMGIEMEAEAVPDSPEQVFYRLTRDIQAEGELVAAVLETAEQRDEGGGIYTYENANGAARVHTGELHIYPVGGAYAVSGDMEDATKLILNKMGVTARLGDRQGDTGEGEVHYLLTVEGQPVVGAGLTFAFSGGYLTEISGYALTGTRQRYAPGEQIDAITALVRLAGQLRGQGTEVSRFLSAEPGYYLREGAGYYELRPVWYVETDAGPYTVDRQTGEIH